MTQSNQPNSDSERVVRLEESTAFTERTIENLSGEIAELNKRMKHLTDRLAGLEQRLQRIVAEESETESGEP